MLLCYWGLIMSKIKVPMRVDVTKRVLGYRMANPFSNDTHYVVRLAPLPIEAEFTQSDHSSISELECVHATFRQYVNRLQLADMQTLYAIHSMLKSARVDNAFDMLTLNKQLLPLLDEVIAQADPDNYELEIIK